jgi:FkbH-like protein
MEPGTLLQRIRSTSSPLSATEYARLGRELNSAPVADLRPLRVGILSSCTLQFVESALLVEGARRALQLSTHFGPFGQFEQQIGEAGSALRAFEPQALVLFMRPEDIDPDAFHRFYGRPRTVLGSVVERLIQCARLFRQHSSAPVLVANFAPPASLPLGPFDANASSSLTHALAAANRELSERAAEVPGVVVWDYAGLVRAAGTDAWCDRRMWALARVPVAADKQPQFARHLARSLAALVRPPAKCLVLDLDNTVWGGVIGDDGLEGIQLGDDYPGSVFKSFQRAVLGLADRGILLAIVSKNDLEVVERALREHPEMLIRPEHLSAMRVNWRPKSENLREIAKELNIGLDALVHFDDNPAERAEIGARAPEVLLVDVPSDPLGYERALDECGFFDTLTVSEEDRQRVQMYTQERARDAVRQSTGNVEDFLDDLEMNAEVGAVSETTLSRAAQLIGKTNQFNLTTRRHSQAELSRLCRDHGHATVYLRLRDRFGDLGLIAVGILAFEREDAVIDSLVMSCRAMGRRAEVALVAEMAELARTRGSRKLIGHYIPTPRNGVVANLYESLGFSPVTDASSGGRRFELDLTQTTISWPTVIARSEPSAAGIA